MTKDLTQFNQFCDLVVAGVKCDFCGWKLLPSMVKMYPHENGIDVPQDFISKQWVYVECDNPKCNYSWSWWKIIRHAKAKAL